MQDERVEGEGSEVVDGDLKPDGASIEGLAAPGDGAEGSEDVDPDERSDGWPEGRLPSQAAQALGVSLSRYYQLEARALKGFWGGCEPRALGRRVTPERELEAVRQENAKLRQECSRYAALTRASQRAVGLAMPAAAGKNGKTAGAT